MLRFLHDRDEILVVLATFGILLMLEDAIMLVFGTDPYFAPQPMMALGHVEIGGIARDVYGLTMIALALAVATAVWLGLRRSRFGKVLSTVIYDRELAAKLGINVRTVFLCTFVLGAVLGALGGAYVAHHFRGARPGHGSDRDLVRSGRHRRHGKRAGRFRGVADRGAGRALAVHKFPEYELFVIYVVMALVLVFKREGLFGPPRLRRI